MPRPPRSRSGGRPRGARSSDAPRTCIRLAITALVVAAVQVTPARLAQAEDATPDAYDPPRLRLVHLTDGLRSASPKQDLRKLRDAEIYKRARATGLDLQVPGHDLIAQHFENGRVFYVFYKTADVDVRARPYLIQRIKKTVRSWTSLDTEPEEEVTYQVEVFKTFAGALKRPDQHYGSFGLRGFAKREIVKEYEIGIGEIPGTCEGESWPYDPGRLYELPYPYGPEMETYDAVRFVSSTTWGLDVSLDQEGVYVVRSPELGIDAPGALPERSRARPAGLDASRHVLLTPGEGTKGVVVGESTPAALREALGDPLQLRRYGSGSRNLVFAKGITVNVAPDGKAKTVMTRPGFLGRTPEGIGHGSTRAQVMAAYGVPKAQLTDAATWRLPGIVLWFDGYHTVDRMVILARR